MTYRHHDHHPPYANHRHRLPSTTATLPCSLTHSLTCSLLQMTKDAAKEESASSVIVSASEKLKVGAKPVSVHTSLRQPPPPTSFHHRHTPLLTHSLTHSLTPSDDEGHCERGERVECHRQLIGEVEGWCEAFFCTRASGESCVNSLTSSLAPTVLSNCPAPTNAITPSTHRYRLIPSHHHQSHTAIATTATDFYYKSYFY